MLLDASLLLLYCYSTNLLFVQLLFLLAVVVDAVDVVVAVVVAAVVRVEC